ncbi:hypothetical protein FACS1894172_05160 [Spirochaetia bacterium]|nr:hypothetical protein FACS1894164_05780 [Spirochaetia bacterium]GHU31000.1 hypothetical protein FACS1894172_05160 [Spirochaetia bacterium]
MPVAAMSPVRICHALECFYFGIDMLNNNPLARKSSVIRLLLRGQLILLARLLRYPAVRMQLLYSKIPKIGVYADRLVNRFPDDAFIHLEVMFAAFGFLYINDSLALLLDDYLRLYRMPLFLARISVFLVSFGRFIGLAVMSTTM